jgi:hypothetical protein
MPGRLVQLVVLHPAERMIEARMMQTNGDHCLGAIIMTLRVLSETFFNFYMSIVNNVCGVFYSRRANVINYPKNGSMPFLGYSLANVKFQRKNSIATRKSAMEFEKMHSVLEKVSW